MSKKRYTVLEEPSDTLPINGESKKQRFTVLEEPKPESNNDYENYLSGTKTFEDSNPKIKQNQIFDMVDRLPEMPGDHESKKQIIKDLIARGGTPQEVTQTMEVLRGKHPDQKGGFKYYMDNGVAFGIPNDGKPPEGHHVASLFGSESDAKDDNVITDIAKTAWNILPSIAGDVVSLANTGVQLATGEKSKNLTSLENAADYLKFEKDPDIEGSLLKTENIKDYKDILKGENWDFSPKTIWGNALALGQTVGEFMVPAAIAGKAVKGSKWATKTVDGVTKLTTAGEYATAGVASYIVNAKEVAEGTDAAGLTGREAAAFKTIVPALMVIPEVKLGLGAKIFKNSAIKEEKDAFVTSMAKKVLEKKASGELTEEALNDALKEITATYPKLVQRWALESGKDALKQGGEEAMQESIKSGSEQIFDNLTDEDKAKFGTDITSPESVANILNNFAAGMIGAGPTAVAFNKIKQIEKDNNQSKSVFGIVQQGDEAIKNFKQNVAAAKEAGDLSETQAQDAITRVNAYEQYNKDVTPLNIADEKKREVFDLVFQKENLKSKLDIIGDPKDLGAIGLGIYHGIEKQASDLQKRINEIITEAQIKDETVVAEKTVKDVAKQNEPPKEGEEKSNLSPAMEALINRNKEIAKKADTRPYNEISNEEYNSRRFRAEDKHGITVKHLETLPDNRIEDSKVVERGFTDRGGRQNSVFEIEKPNGKKIALGSSMVRSDTGGRGHLVHLQPRSLMKQDENGVWEIDDEKLNGAPVGMKVYTIENDGRKKKAIKVFSTAKNEDYGKFIGWTRETRDGKNDYSYEEINGKGGLIDIEHIVEKPLSAEETQAKPIEPVTPPTDFHKLVKEAVSEKELDAIIDQADKAEFKLDFDLVNKKRNTFKPAKPTVKMEFISAKELANSSNPLESKKKHDKVKEKFKDLKQLIDCLWT